MSNLLLIDCLAWGQKTGMESHKTATLNAVKFVAMPQNDVYIASCNSGCITDVQTWRDMEKAFQFDSCRVYNIRISPIEKKLF